MEDPDGEGLLDIDLRTLMMILAIDRAGSITGAAKLLGYSQPAISQHLRRAEARLGVPLVRKAGRLAQLTDAGRVILRVAPSIHQGLRFASAQIREIRETGAGRLRIAGFSAASVLLVPSLLTRIRAEHPGTETAYTELEPLDAVEAVLAGECDAAIVYRFPTSPYEAAWLTADAFDLRDVFRDPLHVVLPVSHPLADAGELTMEQLRGELWTGPRGSAGQCLRDLTQAAGYEPEVAYATDNVSASVRLVSRGFGVALASTLDLRAATIADGVSVVRVAGASRGIAVASGAHLRESPLVLEVLRQLRRTRIDASGD